MSPKNVICTFHSNWKFAKSNKSKICTTSNVAICNNHENILVVLVLGEKNYFLIVCVSTLLSSSGPIVNVKSKLGPEIGFVMGWPMVGVFCVPM